MVVILLNKLVQLNVLMSRRGDWVISRARVGNACLALRRYWLALPVGVLRRRERYRMTS